MIKIGVVSDTHSRGIPKQLLKDFKGVDLVIHAGDFCSVKDLEVFEQLKEVKAVYGNMDENKLRQLLPRRQIFECEGLRIGIFHGEGSPQKIIQTVKNEFKDEKVDVMIFGHSHCACNEKIGSILFFNPGSPNDKICAPFCSYGILEIKNRQVVGKIMKVEE